MPVAPPRPKGPPLNALRAFEAAARLGGFANAAEELCVTPGAISQHIRALEDWAGTPLFARRSQGVHLTRAGATLLPQFTHAFDEIGLAVRALRAAAPAPTVHIAVLPSIAQLWLGPRLPAIRAALPGVKLSISALEGPPNLAREIFDLSLFLRPAEAQAGLKVLDLDALLPVCAPHLADSITAPGDLSAQVLLHDASWAGDWARWAHATGADLPYPDEGPRYTLYALALAEAMAGAGVLMGHSLLVQGALARGDLIAPLQGEVQTGQALVLELPPAPSRAVRQVADLLAK
ncbi:LysR family transcriptional regulator [Rhodobacteraceae bacterium KMM 6894]|nr:LysR family transcriptional regulator [Rhodobacteraceae bacterium KMM 6894]